MSILKARLSTTLQSHKSLLAKGKNTRRILKRREEKIERLEMQLEIVEAEKENITEEAQSARAETDQANYTLDCLRKEMNMVLIEKTGWSEKERAMRKENQALTIKVSKI
ncbi:hypothetical protein PM082_010160 [Marasmius tenuissimus]|nr:hypothetical protein PM082_010160 [Marasmius tenuissimus]